MDNDASVSGKIGIGGVPPKGMQWIPAGRFVMGSNRHYPEEAPEHPVSVSGFWADIHPVTNREFRRFTDATGYVTLAERPADKDLYPDADPALLAPASAVFVRPTRRVDMSNAYNWWRYVAGANWRHPQGPLSSIADLDGHPVVHIAFEDASAYAQWSGKALPTEAEMEYAARGGLDGAEFAWGNDFTQGGRHLANTWQGEFPYRNDAEDGHQGTSPVDAFPANGYGLHDVTGNVWQWTEYWYVIHPKVAQSCCTVDNPRGGSREQSFDPNMPGTLIPRKVTKGGSHLCAPNYCQRYRPAARMAQPVDTSTSHLGFRCIIRS